MEKVKVGVIGVTGYAGAELVRLLAMHPQVELVKVGARSAVGCRVDELFPGLAGIKLACSAADDSYAECDYVFLALPHGVSMEYLPQLIKAGARVIDLGADFRFSDAAVYERTYEAVHSAKDLLGMSVYGLTEYYRDAIRAAPIVGNPGCYPTAAILALRPLLAGGLVEKDGIIIDAKSGVSGAGRGLAQERLLAELNENFRAYKPVGHRHTAEINQYVGAEVAVTFTPHLLPVQRGILATCYLTLRPGVEVGDIVEAYAERYADEPFVHCHQPGVLPELRWAVGSNSCHLGFAVDRSLRRLIVVAVLDNLLKGAAGQAVQNMNVMAGFPETMGLPINAPIV